MKKIFYFLPVLLLTFCFLLTGCNSQSTVTIYLNNGSEKIEKIVETGSTVELPDDFTAYKNYLEFDNWFTDASFKNQFYEVSKINGNISIYAKWKLKQGYGAIKMLTNTMKASGIEKGDNVIIKQTNLSDIKKTDVFGENGSIIAFYSSSIKPNSESSKSNLSTTKFQNTSEFKTGLNTFQTAVILHQVIGIYYDTDGHTWFETKGTNNTFADTHLIRGDYVLGEMVEVFDEYQEAVGGLGNGDYNLDGSVEFTAVGGMLNFESIDANCQVNTTLTGVSENPQTYQATFDAITSSVIPCHTEAFDFETYPTAVMTISITNNSTERVLSTKLKDNITEINRVAKSITFAGENYTSNTILTIGIGETKSFVITFTENQIAESNNENFDFTLYLADGE